MGVAINAFGVKRYGAARRRGFACVGDQMTDDLAQLLLEHRPVEPRPGPSRPAPASRKRIIKTRFKGTVVGELRPSAPGQPVLLDVKAPMTGNVIATFHEKTPGVWVERIQPGRRRPPAPVPDLATQISLGQALLDGVESFIRQTEAHAKKPGRIPVEIEEQFQHKAEQLDESAKSLEQARLRANSTEEPPALIAQLNQACERLYAEGYRIRVDMLKRQPPTAARIEWLKGKNEIDIVPGGARRRLKGPRKDYLQEYEIRERGTANTLWYAHFHYAGPDTPADAFTAAHLKRRDQRLLAGQQRAAAAGLVAVAGHRVAVNDGVLEFGGQLASNQPRAKSKGIPLGTRVQFSSIQFNVKAQQAWTNNLRRNPRYYWSTMKNRSSTACAAYCAGSPSM